MREPKLVSGAIVAVWLLAWSGLAGAAITTFVGRQIGDGRAATAASLNRPFGLAFASDGALLIADRLHHRIRRVDPTTGVITTAVGTVAGGAGNGMLADQAEVAEPVRVRVDPMTFDLIITEVQGQSIRRVTAATGVISRIAGAPGASGSTGDGGPATAALLNGPTDAVPDAGGGILIADRLNHKIRRIDALGTMSTVAGNGTAGYAGDLVLGSAAAAQLNSPNCVLPIPTGGFYLCDEQNHAIRKVDVFNTITTVAGNGMAGFADGPAVTAQFNGPVNLAFGDGTGNVLLVADRLNNRIRHIDLLTATVSTIAGNGTGAFTPDGAAAATSAIFRPAAILIAPDNRILFAEDGAHRVRAIDGAGNLTTLAGDGVASFGGDGGPKGDAQFGQLKSVFRDKKGNFLLSDAGNNRVRRLNFATGTVETLAGSGDAEFGGDGGPALDAGLTLSAVLEDADGNLIISDTDNERIRKVDASGTITTIVGTGVPGFSGDGGPASAAQINHPTGIQLDAAGNLFIADFLNNVVRKVDTAGIITTVAGVQGPPGFNGDDIPATTATLANPTDIDIDEAGNLYIADFENHRIRRVDAATGVITTVAGTGVAGNDGDGGPAVAARLAHPSDVKLDETGALWVADFDNQRVRRFTLGGNIDAAAGTGERGWTGDGGDPLAARLLFPIRLLVLRSDQVLIADRDNFVVRALGDITPLVPSDCTGDGAATCIPGGGKSSTDCATEFKMAAPGGGASLSCTDGDPACDADEASNGRCTFRMGICLNNEDARLGCTPGSITAIKLTGKPAKGAAGQALIAGLAALAPTTPLGKGVGVGFNGAFGDLNACTEAVDVVVARKKKKGKAKLGAVTTASSGKDKDKLKFTCLR